MMEITGLDHVEFYVGDAPLAAFYLCKAFGFVRCAQTGPESGVPEHRSLLLGQGEIRLVLTSGLTASHPATTYVARHGDGVANIALATPDAAGAFAEAVERGAVPSEPPRVHKAGGAQFVTAAVHGFGDVTHRFVERQGSWEQPLPGFVDVPDPELDDPLTLLSTVDHLAVCLPEGHLARTARFYEDVFGFKRTFSERIEFGAQAMDSQVVQSPSEQVTLTLIEPLRTPEAGQIDAFLARHGGAGVQHLAMLTDDIVPTVRALRARGVRFLNTPDAYYEDLAHRLDGSDAPLDDLRETSVLMDRDRWGELFQIFSESMHVRGTFFSEIIARKGARTFGTRNIRALYAAVARSGITA